MDEYPVVLSKNEFASSTQFHPSIPLDKAWTGNLIIIEILVEMRSREQTFQALFSMNSNLIFDPVQN